MTGTPEHIVKSFEQELKRLRTLITDMGGLVERQVALACDAVLDRNTDAANEAVEADQRVDALDREAEEFVIRMLALRQPMAEDLRHIVAALKMTGELERIGDYAKNIARRSIVLNQFGILAPLTGLTHMSRLVQENLKATIDAQAESDADKAMEVWRSDETIDAIYNALFRELITYMMEDPRNITPCTHLLFVAKNVERIGDRATNIAEMIYYALKGEPMPEGRPKGDNSMFAIVRSSA